MEHDIALEFRNATKQYPGVLALDQVNLSVRRGEIHALAGENGAGKSTLIKSCDGAVTLTDGEILVNGQSFRRMTPLIAEQNGISVIYQELNSVNDLDVAENIFLGNEIRRGPFIDKKAMIRRSAELLEELKIDIDPTAVVGDLSVGYKQMIEIAKALSHNTRILIMDEPTAALTNSEIVKLLDVVMQLKKRGVTIIYITHRMNEIFQISDRVSVLRDGKMIKTLETGSTNVQELIRLMVGRDMSSVYPPRTPSVKDEIILDVRNLTGNGDFDISFSVHRGELFGIAGLIGAGRTELAQMIFGVAPVSSGEIQWKGKTIRFHSPQQAISQGVFLLPEDRKEQGCLLPLSIRDNISVSSIEKVSAWIVINREKEREVAQKYTDELRIKTPSLEQQLKNLSGGNQQKVIIAKALATDPELLIFDEPTRGIDVGAKREIYQICNDLLDAGKTIIMISSEMEELIGMCDRIMVLSEGHASGILKREEFSQETIMELASRQFTHAQE